MPVPTGRFEGEMIVRCKVSASDAQEHHNQHDRPQRDMRTVKTGQQKKRRSINSRTEGQTQVLVRVYVLNDLQCKERAAQRNC